MKDCLRQGRLQIPNDKKLNVLFKVQGNPHASFSKTNHNVDYSTVIRILKKEKFHPYTLHFIYKLHKNNPHRRLQFCEELQLRWVKNHIFLNNNIFSDEATFCLNRTVNCYKQ